MTLKELDCVRPPKPQTLGEILEASLAVMNSESLTSNDTVDDPTELDGEWTEHPFRLHWGPR